MMEAVLYSLAVFYSCAENDVNLAEDDNQDERLRRGRSRTVRMNVNACFDDSNNHTNRTLPLSSSNNDEQGLEVGLASYSFRRACKQLRDEESISKSKEPEQVQNTYHEQQQTDQNNNQNQNLEISWKVKDNDEKATQLMIRNDESIVILDCSSTFSSSSSLSSSSSSLSSSWPSSASSALASASSSLSSSSSSLSPSLFSWDEIKKSTQMKQCMMKKIRNMQAIGKKTKTHHSRRYISLVSTDCDNTITDSSSIHSVIVREDHPTKLKNDMVLAAVRTTQLNLSKNKSKRIKYEETRLLLSGSKKKLFKSFGSISRKR